jgi:cobyrinic acid a,c-diamide synthase
MFEEIEAIERLRGDNMHGLMLAGTSSNVGKTTATMGLMAAFKAKGCHVLPAKTGPDYIDPMFHQFVTDEPSVNLDTWIVSSERIKTLFYRRLKEDDLAIVEGVMGLYDGNASGSEIGSSAYLAKTLGIPVFLIIDGRGMAMSAAALVMGYVNFDPEVHIAGVIVNRIKSQTHFELLKNAIETRTGVPCVGWIPDDPALTVGSRHLGLIPADELPKLKETVQRAGELTAAHVDLDRMLEYAEITPQGGAADPFAGQAGRFSDLTVGVAWDPAFNFYYHDNFTTLKILGVKLVPFSPLKDKGVPEGVDALYIGGGFPEVFGQAFSDNTAMRSDLKDKLEAGLPCFAECGGLMVLTRSLQNKDGRRYDGVGFLPAETVMTKRLQHFGYVTVSAQLDGREFEFRAHEFHHSRVEASEEIPEIYRITKVKNQSASHWRGGYVKNHTLAGYPHLHFYAEGADDFLIALLKKARDLKEAGR